MNILSDYMKQAWTCVVVRFYYSNIV